MTQQSPPIARTKEGASFSRVGRQPACVWYAIFAPAVAGFALAALVGLGIQIHEPRFHDEFSHLLAAETFLRCRLTNPTPPQWEHFETFHVLSTPTRMSKYPPGQGLLLATGMLLGGHPIVGSWIGVGLMGAAITWMLMAWFPARWASLAGLLAVVRYGVVGMPEVADWGQSYWGGQLAAAGGALVLGAIPRVVRAPTAGAGWAFGTGLALLVLTRPYEGLLMTGAAVLAFSLGPRGDGRLGHIQSLRRPLLRTVIVLALTASALGYYNKRVTGSIVLPPYLAYERAYGYTPLFVFQSPRPAPEYRHEVMQDFYRRWAARPYEAMRHWSTLWAELRLRLRNLWRWYLGLTWTLPAAVGLLLTRGDARRLSLGASIGVGGANLVSTYSLPHYLAPATGALMILVAGAVFRAWSADGWKRRAGRVATVALVLATVGDLLHRLPDHARDPRVWERRRAAIEHTLAATASPDLILVRYRPGHSYHEEWVYNHADLRESPVIWARSMGPVADRELTEAFSNRKTWLLEVGGSRFSLHPYPVNASAPGGGT